MKKILRLISLSLLLVACSTQPPASYDFYLGTYTDGSSEGIYSGTLNADGTFSELKLAAKTENPSYLCFAHNQNVLLAVSEVDIEGTGTLEAYAIADEGLQHVSTSLSGGAHPCHIASNDNGDILMANYTGGNIGYATVDEAARLSELVDVAQHQGKSITQRQTAPHAHSAWFLSEKEAVAVDLGIDQLIFYNLSNEAKLQKEASLSLEAGAGPRHLAFHPLKDVLYVINELNSSVSVVAKDDDQWHLKQSLSTLPNGYDGQNFCADIKVSNDGRFLYASNRGHNSLAIYEISTSGVELKLIAHQNVKGNWPRNFALTPDNKLVVVANQRSNNLVTFKRNAENGLLSFLAETQLSSPVCVLFK